MPTTSTATSLPTAKAARLIGVHPNTLRAWAAQGRVPCQRINGRGDRRFLVEDLLTLASEAGATSSPPVVTAEAMADARAQIDSIARLGSQLNHLGTPADIGTAICHGLRELIDYHNVRVYRVHGEDVVPVAWLGAVEAYTDEDGEQLRLRVGQGITGWVAEHGVAQYLPDAMADPRSQHIPGTEEELAESLLVAPMLSDGEVIGVVVLAKLGYDRFTPGDLRYLEIYASVAAQAMANADISMRLRAQERTLDRQLRGQAELLRVTERILTTLDPAAVIAEVADSLAGLIPVDSLGVYVHQPAERTLEPLLARGVGASAFMARRLPDSGAVVSQVLTKGEARSVRRPARGPIGEPAALIIAPLRGPERVMGILHVKRLGAGANFDEREFDLVRLFAAHVSIALQNALAHKAVELRAQTDALTGLRNHGTFRDDLQAAVRAGRPFSLLMLDLDDFKSYNDRHGHEAGNTLLRGIAGAITSACRETDRVYRYGGDEFCLILPGAAEGDAIEVAERLQRAIEEVGGGRHRSDGMRCSVGVATFPHDAADRAELLLAADRALYAAKRAGRDRVGTAAGGRSLAGEMDAVPLASVRTLGAVAPLAG